MVATIADRFLGISIFSYPDLRAYLSCDVRSPNGFFSLLLCGLDIKDISSLCAVGVAVCLATLRDIVFLRLVYPYLSQRGMWIVTLLLAMHPYLAFYHVRLSTTLFAGIAFVLLFLVIERGRAIGWWARISFFVLGGLRNTTIPIFVAFEIVELWRSQRRGYAAILGGVASIAVLLTISRLPDLAYAQSFFVNAAYNYPLGFFNILAWFETGWAWVDVVLAVLTTIMSHLVLLLGFREATFTDFPHIFFPLTAQTATQIALFVCLCIFHAIGLIEFFRRFAPRDRRYLLLLLSVFPAFLFVAHMRYLLPLIPFAVFGVALVCDAPRRLAAR